MLLQIGVRAQVGVNFTGDQNFLTVTPFYAMPTEFTIEAWIKTSQTSTGTLVTWNTHNANAFLFRIRDRKLEVGEWMSGWRELRSTSNINTNNWRHVAVTRSGTNVRLYVDGILENSASNFVNVSTYSVNRLTIGALQTNFNESYNGHMDELRIWNRALSANEISDNLFTNYDSNQANLIVNLKFENDLSNQINNNYGATITGSVPYIASNYNNLNVVPVVRSAAVIETADTPLKLNVNISATSMIYWSVLNANTASPTPQEIESAQVNSGSFFVRAGNTNIEKEVSTNLVVGQNYRVHLVAKVLGVRSVVWSSSVFNYLGTTTNMRQGWQSQNIGVVDLIGSANYNSNTGRFIIKGGGTGANGNADALRVVDTITSGPVELVAKVNAIQNSNTNAFAGIMLRESRNPDAKMIMIAVSPTDGLIMRRRYDNGNNSGGGYAALQKKTLNSAPIWLKLASKDANVSGYYSYNGVDWQQLDVSMPVNFNNNVYASLVVSSRNQSQLFEASFDSVHVAVPAANYTAKDRGLYFDTSKLTPVKLPVYATDSVKLPRPILDANPEWIKMYWNAWRIALTKHLKQPSDYPGSYFISSFYDEAFSSSIYQWDIIFMTMFGKYANHLFPATRSFDNFYARQHPDGLIIRQIDPSGQENQDYCRMSPPLFSWAEYENFTFTKDTARLKLVLPVLEKYVEGLDKHQLGHDTPHKLYWTNGYSSGMDNHPNGLWGTNSRPGNQSGYDHQGWVDLSSQMVMLCNYNSKICDVLGETLKAQQFRVKADTITNRINRWLWNENEGFYFECDVNGNILRYKTILGVWPMLAGVSDNAKNERLVAELKNTASFWRDMIFPAVPADQPEYKGYEERGKYWLGGIWAPTNFMAIKGLSARGYHDFAKEATEKYLSGLSEVFERTNTLWENYAPDRINGLLYQGTSESGIPSDSRKDFVGWTGLGPISLLIEEVIGINPDPINNKVVWRLNRLDRHGIENLVIGDKVTSLVSVKRTKNDTTAVLTVTTNKPYELDVIYNGRVFNFNVQAGTNTLKCEVISTVPRIHNESGFMIYPNPTSGFIILNMPETLVNPTIKVYDINSKLIKHIGMVNTNGLIDLSFLDDGVYFVEVYQSGKKILKSKVMLKK